MMNKVLVVFALREELAPWRRRHRFHRIPGLPCPAWRTSIATSEVCVALAGAGAPDTGYIENLTTDFNPSLGIVTGVAAGLQPEWRPGDLLVAQSVCGPNREARIPAESVLIDLATQCGAKPAATLITLPRIARTSTEKARLGSVGDAADMESLALMTQWSARGIPALAVRVILDPVEMPMTCDFEAAMNAHGQVRVTRILAQLAHRPHLLPDFLRLARQSRRSLRILARFLDRFVEKLIATV